MEYWGGENADYLSIHPPVHCPSARAHLVGQQCIQFESNDLGWSRMACTYVSVGRSLMCFRPSLSMVLIFWCLCVFSGWIRWWLGSLTLMFTFLFSWVFYIEEGSTFTSVGLEGGNLRYWSDLLDVCYAMSHGCPIHLLASKARINNCSSLVRVYVCTLKC